MQKNGRMLKGGISFIIGSRCSFENKICFSFNPQRLLLKGKPHPSESEEMGCSEIQLKFFTSIRSLSFSLIVFVYYTRLNFLLRSKSKQFCIASDP